MTAQSAREVCATCGLSPAAFRVEREGRVFCKWYCAEHAAPARDEVPPRRATGRGRGQPLTSRSRQ